MPTLSLYEYTEESGTGPFKGMNHKVHPGMSSNAVGHVQSKTCEAWFRLDNELVIDMGEVLESSIVTNGVNGLLTHGATRAPPMHAGSMIWLNVPEDLRKAVGNAVSGGTPTVRVWFDVHVPAQSGCLAVTPTLSIYIVPRLAKDGSFSATVEGFNVEVPKWMGPPCAGGIADALLKALVNAKSSIQAVVNGVIGAKATGKFKQLYLLPGGGTNLPGPVQGNADLHCSIALVPE